MAALAEEPKRDPVRSLSNRILLTISGRWSRAYSIVPHVGRTSGRQYRNPVSAYPFGDGFVIAVLYGAKPNWVRTQELTYLQLQAIDDIPQAPCQRRYWKGHYLREFGDEAIGAFVLTRARTECGAPTARARWPGSPRRRTAPPPQHLPPQPQHPRPPVRHAPRGRGATVTGGR